jgi:hypothetical protein
MQRQFGLWEMFVVNLSIASWSLPSSWPPCKTPTFITHSNWHWRDSSIKKFTESLINLCRGPDKAKVGRSGNCYRQRLHSRGEEESKRACLNLPPPFSN